MEKVKKDVYREQKREGKKLIKKSKNQMDGRLRRQMSKKWGDSKKLHWKIKRVKGGDIGECWGAKSE